MGEGRTDEPQTNQRLTVAQAATALGITEGAVRSRIKRGTLRTTREGGTVFVLLGGGTTPANPVVPGGQSELVEALREQIADLREQLAEANAANRENRRIIAGLTSRIPELQAAEPTEPPGGPQTAAEPSEGSEPRSATGGPQTASQRPQRLTLRGLGRRIFGGS
jgi:hypothetical protein